MRLLVWVRSVFQSWFRKQQLDRELDDELRSCVRMLVEEKVRAGMDPEEAARRARIELGGVEQVKERVRERRLGAGFDTLAQDLRYALRILLRGRGLTVGAALTLALGIGAATALFSAVDSTLLRPLPFKEPEQLVRVSLLIPPGALPGRASGPLEMVWSYPKYRLLREYQDVFEDLATYHRGRFTLSDGEQAERVVGEVVGGSYFSVLGLTPALGRDFLPEEDAAPGNRYAVMLSHTLWSRSFGSDPGVLGRSIRLNGVPYTVVGVGPAGFNGLWGTAELWVPTMTEPVAALTSPGHSYAVIARLLPGITSEQLATTMSRLGAQVDRAYPSPVAGGHWSATARPLNEYRTSARTRQSLLILFAATALVLMVACVNISGLLLSRGLSREKEVAVRVALGASRARLIRQSLIEGGILSLIGGVIGVVIATIGVHAFNAVGAAARFQMLGLERLSFSAIRIDARTLAFSMTVMALAPLLFSVLPGVVSSRIAPAGLLKGSGESEAPRASRTRRAIVVIQVALAFVLMVGSTRLLTAVRKLHAVDMGFEFTSVLSLRVALPEARYDRAASQLFINLLVEQVQTLPGVEAVTFANCAPLADECRNTASVTAVDGMEFPEGGLIGVTLASPGYFEALRVPSLAGRLFSSRDVAGGPQVAVISRTAADRFWPGEDPLGRRLSLGRIEAHVIGVVGDVHYSNLENTPLPEVYLPTTQRAQREGYLLVRAAGDPMLLLAPIRARVRELDPGLPIFDVRTMRGRVSDATWETRFITLVFCLFAVMTLALAAVGLFGAQSFSVRRQTRAIGIRMALGADRGRVVSSVVLGGVATTGAGILVGIGVSLATARSLRALLFDTDPRDPMMLAAVSALFLMVAIVASYLPGRSAAKVDPVEVLRAE